MTKNDLLSFDDFANLAPDQMYHHLVKGYQDIEKLKEDLQYSAYEIARLRHQLFGKKSEKLKAIMLHPTLPAFDRLFDESPAPEEAQDLEDEPDQDAKDRQELEEKPAASTKKTGRKALPDHLPREKKIHELALSDQTCECGHPLHKMGEEVCEQLDYIPAKIKVIQQVRYKYTCKGCENGVTLAPAPKQPIPKSMASSNLLAHIFVSKFDDHLPLYRQAEIWQRLGVDLNRATLSNWVIKAGALCQPLVDQMRAHIVASPYVQADETPVKVLNQSKSRQKSYMWLYKTGSGKQQSLVYDYQQSRSGEHATSFLNGFAGYLQGDAYGGYNAISRQPGVKRVGCMAHARRKFVEVVNMAPIHKGIHKQGYAHQAVQKIKKLYEIEGKIKDQQWTPDQIKHYRIEHAKPLLDELKNWFIDIKPKAPPKSPLGRAIGYALDHWTELTRYLEDGDLAIDNNGAERAIKPFTVGRKNWLFMGNEKGAKSAAALYSLIETAKANGVDPYHYLAYVLQTLPNLNPDQINQLLPWNCPSSLQHTFKLTS